MAADPAVHALILDAAEAVVRGLDLDTAAGRPGVEQLLAVNPLWLVNVMFPCVVVSPVGVESEAGITTLTSDYSYPLVVTILDRASSNPPAARDYLAWRKAIRDAFHRKRLTGVGDVSECVLQPSNVVEPLQLESEMLFSMPLNFNVISRELRG